MGVLNRVQSSLRHIDEYDSKAKETEQHLSKEINIIIQEIKNNCDRLDVLVAKEPAQGAKRANAKFRIDQLKTDTRCVKSSYASLQALLCRREQDARNRKSLLNTSFRTNAESAIQNGLMKESSIGNSESTSILIERAMAQNEALGRSSRAVDDILSQGGAMLGKNYLIMKICKTA
jgi:hypothetical protein